MSSIATVDAPPEDDMAATEEVVEEEEEEEEEEDAAAVEDAAAADGEDIQPSGKGRSRLTPPHTGTPLTADIVADA